MDRSYQGQEPNEMTVQLVGSLSDASASFRFSSFINFLKIYSLNYNLNCFIGFLASFSEKKKKLDPFVIQQRIFRCIWIASGLTYVCARMDLRILALFSLNQVYIIYLFKEEKKEIQESKSIASY